MLKKNKRMGAEQWGSHCWSLEGQFGRVGETIVEWISNRRRSRKNR
jgi:hypothetical protein